MDAQRFDDLARLLSSRRTALGAALTGLLLPLEAVARGKGNGKKRNQKEQNRGKNKGKGNGNGKGKDKGKGRDKQRKRTTAQADACWRAGACIPKKGANVSRCDLAGYPASPNLDCTGCNLSRANLRDATFTGTNFTKANLSGACLIDADFTGATFANNTNLYNAIFCNTTMPDGSVNNSGCNAGTACCSTCTPATCQSLGKTCGEWPDGCGNTLQCGGCPGTGSLCCGGSCVTTWSNQTTFGSKGNGPSQFDVPFGIALSGDTLTAWVADYLNDRISIWTRPNTGSTTWSNQTTFGSSGSDPSQFDLPSGIALSGDTLTAWVADSYNARISIWTRPSAGSTTWSNQTTFGSVGAGPSQFDLPTGIAVSGDALTAWVADYNNHRISIWTRPNAGSTTWTNQTTFGSSGSGPSQFSRPAGIAVAGDTLTAWVADPDNHRISVWTRPNASSTTWANQTTFGSVGSGPSQFQYPTGIVVSGDTLTAWVAELGNSRISIWTRPSASSTTWSNQTTFGSLGSGPSQLNQPRGVAVSGDALTAWVADSFNNRVSIWGLVCPE